MEIFQEEMAKGLKLEDVFQSRLEVGRLDSLRGKMAMVRPCRESNSRPTSTETDTLNTRTRAGACMGLFS